MKKQITAAEVIYFMAVTAITKIKDKEKIEKSIYKAIATLGATGTLEEIADLANAIYQKKMRSNLCDFGRRAHHGKVEIIKIIPVFSRQPEANLSKRRPDLLYIKICKSCKDFLLKKERYICISDATGYTNYTLD